MHRDRITQFAFVGGVAALAALAAIVISVNWDSLVAVRPPEFSQKNMLQALWFNYKGAYLEDGTFRSLDKQRDGITTSEGQSYSMLRAVWMDDKETFDRSWQWTKDNIQRREDRLFAWLFGEREDGTYGILTDRGGYNTATDADVDIALALLFAHQRWSDETYFGDAVVLLRDIWEKEVVVIQGKPYLAANNIEKTAPKETVIVNPSYLAPYAYKIFHEVDSQRDWLGLASTSYEVAKRSIDLPLDSQRSAGLPPDWVAINRHTGEITSVPQPTSLTTDFSYDALRTPWRFALDWVWFEDPRAKEVLDSMGFLADEWRRSGRILSSYRHDGSPASEIEAPAMYGGAIGYFMASDSKTADEVYRRKLEGLYDTNMSRWSRELSYYDENWAWFGMALYAGELHNLYQDEDEDD